MLGQIFLKFHFDENNDDEVEYGYKKDAKNGNENSFANVISSFLIW